jgi:chemotaxis protein methyltransferase CheR
MLAAELSPATLDALIGLVRDHTGIAMSERKSALLQGRLQPRLRALALPDYEHYLALLRAGGPEVQAFINTVTTSDTGFFRTPAVWSWFEEAFLTHWLAQGHDRTLRIWSAAAASGEEAYSLAMLCEQARLRAPQRRSQVLGSEISSAVLAAAQAGRYEGRSLARLQASHPELLGRYFRIDGEAAVAGQELRANLRFCEHNLLRRLKGADQAFDLVMLRNVLIYFDEDNQRRVLAQVQAHMAPGARLVLGEQESVTRLGSGLRYLQPHVYAAGDDHG